MNTVTDGLDVAEQPDRAHRALEEILQTMAKAPRLTGVTPQSMRLREQQMLVRLARLFRVEEPSLRARLQELRERHTDLPSNSTAGSPLPLLPSERELLQILLVYSELVGMALESIQNEQLSTPLARQLWQLYQTASEQQTTYHFEQILTATEDPALKSVLVQLYEDACGKAEVALEDAEARLHGLFKTFDFERERTVQTQSLAALQQQGYHEEKEIEILQRIIDNERNRQGISAPTDG